MTSRHPSVSFYSAPKAAHSDLEYEDAACLVSDYESGGELSRYAVADGATESSFAGHWARALVMAYCSGLLPEEITNGALNALQQSWTEAVSGMSLAWFAEEKAQHGAFATLCGLTMRADGSWQAHAIGDSCLFQLRDGEIICSFPLENAAQFGNSPEMLCSLAGKNSEAKMLGTSGGWHSGDIFILMTDALACLFLGQMESGRPVADFLARIHSQESFLEYIESCRNLGDDSEHTRQHTQTRLKNDDVTLLVIRV